VSDCSREWAAGDGCAGCWSRIFGHLVSVSPGSILPQPEFCQDAAYIAFVLDERLKIIHELRESFGGKGAG
jgi:hypothetical protein